MSDDEIRAWRTWDQGEELTIHFEEFTGKSLSREASRVYSLMFDVDVEEGSPIDDLFSCSIQTAEIRVLERIGKMFGCDWPSLAGALESLPEDCTLEEFIRECKHQCESENEDQT